MTRPLSSLNLALNRLGAVAAAGFTPTQLSGLVAWWDSTDDDTITESVGNVSAWASKQNVGGIKTLSQGTGSRQPSILDVGGVQMISFDGVDEEMSVTDSGALGFGAGSFSIFAVYRTADVNRGSILNRGSFAPTGYFMRINNADTDNGDFVAAIRDASSNLGLIADTAINYNDDAVRQVGMVRDESVSELVMYQNGTEVAASPADITAVGDIDAGSLFHVGAFDAAAQFYDGELGDILVFNRVLDASEQSDLETFLTTKFGIV